jgi:hypothetical protein
MKKILFTAIGLSFLLMLSGCLVGLFQVSAAKQAQRRGNNLVQTSDGTWDNSMADDAGVEEEP